MIDITNEDLIRLNEVPKLLPKRPNGKRIHISAIYRWSQKGIRGIKLATIRIGGTTYTSRQAIQRFGDSQTDNNQSDISQQPQVSNFTRKSQVDKATEQVLKTIGIPKKKPDT